MVQITGKKSKYKRDRLHLQQVISEVELLKKTADQYLYDKKYPEATDKYKKIISIKPRQSPVIFQEYEKLINKNLNDVPLRMSLVELDFFVDDWVEARYELEEVLELDPGNLQAYLLLARILQKVAPENMGQIFEQAYAYLPDEEEIVDGLVTSYVEKKFYGKAISVYQRLLQKNGESPRIIKILADLFTKNKQYQESASTCLMLLKNKGCVEDVVQKLQELLHHLPESLFIMESLSEAYLLELKPELAVAMLEKICQLDSAKVDDTIKKIKKILQQYPDFVPALIAMGYMYITVRLYSEAVMCFSRFMKNTRYIEESISGYQAVLAVCPEQVLARQYLGEAYMITGRYDQAIVEFDQLLDYNNQDAGLVMTRCRTLLKENDEDLSARLLLAKCYFVREEYKKAYVECSSITLDVPGKILADSYILRIKACYQLDKFDEARKLLDQLIDLGVASKVVHEFCADYGERLITLKLETEKDLEQADPGSFFYLKGQKAFFRNDLEEAIKYFQVSAREARYAGVSYYLLGLCFKSRGRYDLAINQMNRAYEVARDASNYATMNKIRFNIALAYESLGDLRSATDHYEKILENDITYNAVKERMAQINQLSWTNISGKALLGLERELSGSDMIVVWVPNRESRPAQKKDKRPGLVMDISFSQSHNDEGVTHFLKGRIKAAEEEFHLAAQLDHDFTVVYNNLGLLHLEKQNYEEARLNFEHALQDPHHQAVVLANLGLLNYRIGVLDKARDFYQQAVHLDPKLANVLINLGDICYKTGEIDRALNYWITAYRESSVPELAFRRLLFKRSAFMLEEEMPPL